VNRGSLSKRRRWKITLLVAIGVAFVGAGALAGFGLYYSESLKSGALKPDYGPEKFDLRVAALEDGRITLAATKEAKGDGDWAKPGSFGIEWLGGYAQAGSILQLESGTVAREFTPVNGDLKVGDAVRLDSFAFPGDPLEARRVPFEDVTFSSELGALPAWLVKGDPAVWAIFVHGKGANRREALRMLPAVTQSRLSSLVITYRHDKEAPQSPDGFYRYGESEWRDLEAAAQYAANHGAKRLVLVGYSMGGGIVLSFMQQSALAERVEALVLDSPMLDLSATVDHGTSRVPGVLNKFGKKVSGLRFQIHWGRLNYLERAGDLRVPVLLFHGDGDDRVPVETSDNLAQARPDIVTYIRTPGAGHVRSWNTDASAYEKQVRDFLSHVTPTASPSDQRGSRPAADSAHTTGAARGKSDARA
jgi:uncharacterized protein